LIHKRIAQCASADLTGAHVGHLANASGVCPRESPLALADLLCPQTSLQGFLHAVIRNSSTTRLIKITNNPVALGKLRGERLAQIANRIAFSKTCDPLVVGVNLSLNAALFFWV
jgi:hypothetical protein